MKRTLRSLGLLIFTLLLTLGVSQQQTQQSEQQVPNFPDFEAPLEALAELRIIRNELGSIVNGDQQVQPAQLQQMHTRLGAIINEFERHMVGLEHLGERITGLERQAQAGALQQARRDLRSLRADIEAGERPEETAREIGQIRSGLRRAFTGVTGEEQQRATELEEQFRTLEEQVRTGAAEAQTTFDETLDRLEQDIERGQQQFEQEGRQRTIQMAGQRLQGLRGDIEAGQDTERVAGEIRQIRAELERIYQSAEGEERQRFEALSGELGTLEEQVRAGSAEAGATLERTLSQFERSQY